jgi:hypothetical protein
LKHLTKRFAVILLVSSCLGAVYGIGFYNGSRDGYEAGYYRGASKTRKNPVNALTKPINVREIKKTPDINNLFLQAAAAQPS